MKQTQEINKILKKLDSSQCLKVDTDGQFTFVTLEDNSLNHMQDMVGGYIEVATWCNSKWCVVVNEEGMYKKLPYNEVTSKYIDMYILGSALFVHKKVMK